MVPKTIGAPIVDSSWPQAEAVRAALMGFHSGTGLFSSRLVAEKLGQRPLHHVGSWSLGKGSQGFPIRTILDYQGQLGAIGG